jgi:hypothetical protein
MKTVNIALWFLLFSFQLFAQDHNWKVYTPANSGLPDLPLSSIAIENNDIKWIMAANSLIRFDGINWEVFDSSNSIIPNGFYGVITKGGDGNAWIGGFNGLGEYNVGVVNVSVTPWVVYDTSNSQLAFNSIAGLTPSRDGGIWINSWPGYLTSPGTVQKLTDENWFNSSQQTNNYISEMEEDLNGNLWYTNLFAFGGVFKIDGDTTIWYQFLDVGASNIETDPEGNVWMGWSRIIPDSSGLLMYDGMDWVFYNQNNSNLQAYWVRNLVTDSLGNLWMSGDGLIMYDGNDFTQYTAQNSGLYSTNISDIQIDEFNNKWIIHPNAISVYNEDGITSVAEELHLPNAFKLQQNYPNPFNPTTTINYQIPKISFVTLKIYDVLGSEIATLVSEEKPVGNYEVEFDGSGLTSGVYFYTLQAGDFVETKKIVLMK